MGKLKERLKKIHYMHYIAIGITICFVLVSIFVFPNAYTRIWESLQDLWSSLQYYAKELFKLDIDVRPSVIDKSVVPFTPIFNLPATWEEFTIAWGKYWNLWASSDNFTAYLSWVADFLFYFCQVLLIVVVPLFLLSYLFFQRYLSKQNNDYNKESKPLKYTKWLATKIYIPVKNWLKRFFAFLQEKSAYWKWWLFIWAFNFNFITIIIEFIAFYLYFVISFDKTSIYMQLYKLACDLSVILAFMPVWAWCLIGYLFVCWWRKKIGYARLEHFENKNCGMINERPIVIMVCGTMGKKKTTAITDIALSQEKMLRDKAFEKLLDNDLKFPYFAWCNLENAIKYAMKKHYIYNLATTRLYMQRLAYFFYLGEDIKDKQVYKSIKRHLRKRYNIKHDNLCFDYDYKRYGLYFDDKLKVVDLWQVLETYAQLYFVYVIQSSLIISNYSIRTDNLFEDLGNFPMWNTDFFRRDSRLIDAYSRHAHIIDFDALRLGRKLVEDNPKKDSFDFGVVNITEVGKERKNNLELQEKKKKDETTNQKNDGFNDWLKMIRHSATIDNFPFVKVITDEQRPESWGADARDLTEIVHINETSDTKLAMPFFTITELLYSFVFSKFARLYYKYRFIRSDNTLPMYMLKKFTSMLHNYYNGIYNTFGYCKLDIGVESGTQDGTQKERNYYLIHKKIYSKRFSTDCFSDFFTQKNLNSPVGIDDLEEYATEKATFEELKQQNSYFINDLMNKKGTDTDND
ncbi:MAG: hypothetical protein IJY90_01755 [Clostridia bacterium]|nr:hypothetical protein [Clostridia bacterium]